MEQFETRFQQVDVRDVHRQILKAERNHNNQWDYDRDKSGTKAMPQRILRISNK